MRTYFLRATIHAVALAILMAVTVGDPPTDGERALRGLVLSRAASSNLRLSGLDGQITPARALQGRLPADREEPADESVIQVRPGLVDGATALLGLVR